MTEERDELKAEVERLREGLRTIAEQTASIELGAPWTHWRMMAERILDGNPPHHADTVKRAEEDRQWLARKKTT